MEKLKSIKPHLQAKYPLKAIGLFGSYARDEASSNSDIDILVEFNASIGWEIMDLTLELDELFGQEVDLITQKAIQGKQIEKFIFKDLVYV